MTRLAGSLVLVVCCGATLPAQTQIDTTKLPGFNNTAELAKMRQRACAQVPDGPMCAAFRKQESMAKSSALPAPDRPQRHQPARIQEAEPQPLALPFAAVPVQLTAGRGALRFFHSAAAFAAGINFRAWRENEGLRGLAGKMASQRLPERAAAAAPLFEDVDQVWIVLDKMDASGKPAEPVLLVKGTFRNPMWEQLLGASVGAGSSLLVGKPAAVAAVRRRLRAPAPPGELALEAEKLSKSNDVWFVGAPGLLPPGPGLMTLVPRFSATMNVREKLEAELNLTAGPAAVQQILEQFRRMEREALEQAPPAGTGLTAEDVETVRQMVRSIAAEQTASGLRFRLSVEPEQLQQLAERANGARQAGQRNSRKAVIHGMEGGPREVPLDGQR